MKDMIYEMVMKQQTPLQDVVEENVVEFDVSKFDQKTDRWLDWN